MTTSKAAEADRRRRPEGPAPSLSFADLLPSLEARAASATRLRFPSTIYRDDPVGFFRNVLGIEPWAKQIEIIEGVRDNVQVAAKSGHRVGKSYLAAGLALWFYCSWPDARVVLTATTAPQVQNTLWRAVKILFDGAGRCLDCNVADPDRERIPTPCPHSAAIDGKIAASARTGLKSGFREIIGVTVREGEAIQGIAGAHMLFIVDEASGVADETFHGIVGNLASNARIVLLGNPTKNSGVFFDAFNKNAAQYKCFTISSEESPNVKAGREVIEGLAMREWIERRREEWGEDSALFRIKIKGEFATNEDGKIFSLELIGSAEARWESTASEGRLFIGVDPAGEAGTSDEIIFQPRRGLKALEIEAHRGLSPDAHLVRLLALIERLRVPREIPVVVLDAEGSIGAQVHGVFKHYVDSTRGRSFELVAVRASHRARMARIYHTLRDELAGNLHAWMKDGGAIPTDEKLEKDLHLFEWTQRLGHNSLLKLVPQKPEIRKLIGRSPDRYDALALCVWEPLALKEEDARAERDEHDDDDEPEALDPWAARRVFER